MSDYLISIPNSLYEKARRVAEQTGQPADEVIRERLADAFDEALAELPADEVAELRALVESGQRLMLRKSGAMKLLLDRGYKVSLEDLKPANE